MDKKALQEQFEAIAIQNCWNINKYPAGWDGHGDDEYADDFVSGAWWGFQHQQSKVEELQKQLSEYIFVSETLDEMYVKEVQKSDELQKRVDKAIRLLVEAELYQSEPNIDLAVKALKGEG
ncbi:hypothetical protein [Acinetobacter baumannii]|uniref:hypothetical protein n=1 Tax=Acinetobacter baumannii TaxID=470 RepID=UPI003EDB2DD0